MFYDPIPYHLARSPAHLSSGHVASLRTRGRYGD